MTIKTSTDHQEPQPTQPTPIHDFLKDGKTEITIFPFNSVKETPEEIVKIIQDLLNHEIEVGQTYPFETKLSYDEFINYYFPKFVAVGFQGHFNDFKEIRKCNYDKLFLGCYYIKPNYVGRCSHVCNGGFLVDFDKGCRGLGVGKALGKSYLINAVKLGYRYSVFNLVFDSNFGSKKIWEGLGFDRIGVVPEAGRLKLGKEGEEGEEVFVDAIIYGKKLV
ncbi:unnamed protein product [Ambrosiozyma monospora]|uniref:Unnamed protein product n=1 Tax=Ambrosiozyma monospora TaxID=43982 RepID=A0A9W6WFT0_AMBMO|nr:unnamed protein product [Ambrosiozyma monospora]